jgi:hypothetical protein
VRIKAASSYYRDRKPSELASVIKGISYAGIKTSCKTKAASSVEAEKSQKLKELLFVALPVARVRFLI